MEDYPVMLYLGGLDSHAIAHNEDEADALKEKGYVEHDEAVKIEPQTTEQVVSYVDDRAYTLDEYTRRQDVAIALKDEQLAEVCEHIELLEGAIEVKDKEIADLNGKLEDKDKIIAANHEHIDTLRAELAEAKNSKDVNSYDEMTNAELQKLLEQRKVDYNKRDGKDALIKAAKDSE